MAVAASGRQLFKSLHENGENAAGCSRTYAWEINHRTVLAVLADLEASEDEKQSLLALIHTHDKTQKSCSEATCSALIYN